MSSTSREITVLMTVYNGVKFLAEAVESVLNQTFEDFESLIIDDASTDASVELIRSYEDSRIRLVLNGENMGQAASLNVGLELARGRYVARLDQDDISMPRRLDAQKRLLDSRPDVGVVCAWEHSIDEKGRKVREWRSEITDFGAYIGTLTLGLCPVWHPSTMFRRDLVTELGGYNPDFAPAEDFELWVRIAQARFGGAIVPEFLVLQRIHGGRQSETRQVVQEQNTRRAHEQFLETYCNARETEILGLLLRMEKEFWDRCRSRKELERALSALELLLRRIREQLNLSDAEAASLIRRIHRRLGPGVAVVMRLRTLPSAVLFPLLVGLSPMLVSPLRKLATLLNQKLPELRYPGRFVQSRAERLIGQRPQ